MAEAGYSLEMTADPDEFVEAAAEFASRRVVSRAEADAMEGYARRRAWWISGVAQMDVANDAHRSIVDALAKGIKFDDWKKSAGAAIEAEWGRRDSARLLLIYRNATSQAYNAGRWEQMHSPAVAPLRPFVAYDVVWDSRTSKICKPLKDVVLPMDDPFVLNHNPSLHHGCRTGLRSLRASVAKRLGITKNPPDVNVTDGFGYAPNLATPPLPSERKTPPDPAIQLQNAVKGGQYLRGSKPVQIKLKKEHDPQHWAEHYREKYGDAADQVGYGRAMLERAKVMKPQEAHELLISMQKNGFPGLKAWDIDELRRAAKFPKRADQKMVDGMKLLAQHIKLAGRGIPAQGAIDARILATQQKAAEWFKAMAAPALEIPEATKWYPLLSGERAFYGDGKVFLSVDNKFDIAVHEWGHAIEDTERFKSLVASFKKPRESGGTRESLAALHPGSSYRSDEWTIKDEYFSDYMGKGYNDASEILSSIFEWLAKGNIAEMLEKDPESLFFGLGVLAGI